MECKPELYPLWHCHVDAVDLAVSSFQYYYGKRRCDGEVVWEQQARVLNPLFPSPVQDDGIFKEMTSHYFTSWMPSFFGQQGDSLEKKLNDKLLDKIKPLERTVNDLAAKCSEQSEETMKKLEVQLVDATQSLQVQIEGLETRMTSQENRAGREFKQLQRSLDSVLLPDGLMSKLDHAVAQ
ncbi:unnamed protein product, partial [Symbiodinium pilosum]